jgi:hypothetical protein
MRFCLWVGDWTTEESCKNCLRSSRKTHGSNSWNGLAGGKERAFASLQRGPRRFRPARGQGAMMVPSAPAAGRELRVRIRRERRRAAQQKAEQSHQQDCRNAPHCDHYGTSVPQPAHVLSELCRSKVRMSYLGKVEMSY